MKPSLQNKFQLGPIIRVFSASLVLFSVFTFVAINSPNILQKIKAGVSILTNSNASTDTAVLNFISTQNAGASGRGGSGAFYPAIENNGIAGQATDNVVGFSSLSADLASIAMGTGSNTVIIDGLHTPTASVSGADNFSFKVDVAGDLILTDSNTGHSVSLTGVSYLIFQGAATTQDASGNPQYSSMFFIGNANRTEITEIYNASFGRQPDLGDVEYYINQENAGFTTTQIASEFMASPEFAGRYGANVSDATFISNLYQNVLHRTPAATEVAYYAAALQNFQAGSVVNNTNPVLWSREQELLNFTDSPENQQDVAGFVVNLATSPTSGFVYQDTPKSETATQVLTSAQTSGVVDTSLIDTSTITSSVTVGLNGIGKIGNGVNTGLLTLTSTASNGTVILSASINSYGNYDAGTTVTVIGNSTGGSNIGMSGGTVDLSGNGNTVGTGDALSQAAIYVSGFNASDVIAPYGVGTRSLTIVSPSSSAPLQGSTINFSNINTPNYAINVGTVGSGSAAEVAAAANKVFVPGDAATEFALFIGQTSGGDTVIYDWHTPVVNGLASAGSADTNGNHLVDASEFIGGIVLTGVPPSSITASMFYH